MTTTQATLTAPTNLRRGKYCIERGFMEDVLRKYTKEENLSACTEVLSRNVEGAAWVMENRVLPLFTESTKATQDGLKRLQDACRQFQVCCDQLPDRARTLLEQHQEASNPDGLTPHDLRGGITGYPIETIETVQTAMSEFDSVLEGAAQTADSWKHGAPPWREAASAFIKLMGPCVDDVLSVDYPSRAAWDEAVKEAAEANPPEDCYNLAVCTARYRAEIVLRIMEYIVANPSDSCASLCQALKGNHQKVHRFGLSDILVILDREFEPTGDLGLLSLFLPSS